MGRSVLLCDDDRLFALWLSRLLKDWGWHVQTTTSVREAEEAFKLAAPEVVITDLYIGDETAADLLARLRSTQSANGLPVILISAASTAEMQSAVGGAELTMLTKPVDPARLRTVLNEIAPSNLASPDKSLSFLILDNGGIQARVLGRMVEEAGVFVIYAANIENAKTLIRNVRPDAVMLECDGSVTDAEEISAYCVANRLFLPPMVVLSSVINQQLVERLLRAGVVDILLKPISVNRLQEAIRRIGGHVEREVSAREQGRKSVMVVEDFTITAKMFERLLTHEGYQVHVVRSGEMAFEMIRRVRPELMLLDLNLPGMSGTDLLQSLNRTGQAVPTIVVTGDRDPRKLRDLRKLGVLRLFNKPVVPDELISYVGGYFFDTTRSGSSHATYDVLLALSDEVAGNVLATALDNENIKSKVITDGYQAVHEIMSHPRVVILDIVISGLDGTEVMRRAKSILQSGSTKLLAIAEEMDDEIRTELREMGAHDCLGKPYSLNVMTAKIRSLMNDTLATISIVDLADEILPEIRRAITLPDEDLYVAAARLGHNLRNTGELAGLPAVSKLAQALEDAAMTRYRGSCEDILKDMRAEIDRALLNAPQPG